MAKSKISFKTIPHAVVMRGLDKILKGKGKPAKVVNLDLEKSLIKIVNKEILKAARPEAMKLLLKANQKEIGQFLYYYHSQSIVLPSVIDSIKDRLVEEGKLKFKRADHFGLLCKPEFKSIHTD